MLMMTGRWLAAVSLGVAAATVLAQTTAVTDAAQARDWAATCAACHGSNGHARSDMPTLAGMPAQTMIRQMAAFKSGAQAATVMHQIAKGLSDEQIRTIAGYFSAQPVQE